MIGNKNPNVTNSAIKTDYDATVKDILGLITTPEFTGKYYLTRNLKE